MPFRCTQCNRVTQVVAEQECCNGDNLKQCPKIHYLHEQAPGPAYCNSIQGGGVKENKPVNIENSKVLRVGCSTKQVREQATIVPSLVSCPLCLEFLDTVRPPKEHKDKPIPLDKVDMSEDDISQLKAMGINPDFLK